MSASSSAENKRSYGWALRLGAAIAVTVVIAVIQGRATGRWNPPPQLEESDRFVRTFPLKLGKWTFANDGDSLSPRVINELGVTQYVSRNYSDGRDSLTLLLMSGYTSRLVRHPPEICYGAVGNTFLAKPAPARLTVDGTVHELWVLPIQPNSGLEGNYVVVYGFSVNGVCSAPKAPRWAFHGIPAIQKLQILCQPDAEDPTRLPKPAESFLADLCRHLARTRPR